MTLQNKKFRRAFARVPFAHTTRVPLQNISGRAIVAQLVKDPPAMRETSVRSLGWEDSPGEGNGYPVQYPGLENSMACIVPVAAKSRTPLSDFH